MKGRGMKTNVLVVACTAISAITMVHETIAQIPSTTNVFVDVLSFRGRSDGTSTRVDVYLSVPYQTLEFQEFNGTLVGEYSVTTTFRDTTGKRLFDSTYKRSIIEDNYAVSRGKTGKADNAVRRYDLRPGTYRLETLVRDVFGKRDHATTRKIIVPAFAGSTASMSSIMLASDIEQRAERFTITPYVGDVIWSNDVTLFAFVECYLRDVPRRVIVGWDIASADGSTLSSGLGEPVTASRDALQAFVPLTMTQRLVPGSYMLRMRLYAVTDGDNADTSVVLTERSRPYIVPRSLAGNVMNDVARATRQLIYIANQEDIDKIQAGQTEVERLTRFEEYWKKQDPTASTVRNEAFEDYYARIEQANKRFKSYTEGWLTDMGRVFIIYGEPMNVERFTAQNGVSLVVRWTFPNNITLTFEDSTGFGDFRLRTALPGGAKYAYRR